MQIFRIEKIHIPLESLYVIEHPVLDRDRLERLFYHTCFKIILLVDSVNNTTWMGRASFVFETAPAPSSTSAAAARGVLLVPACLLLKLQGYRGFSSAYISEAVLISVLVYIRLYICM